MSMISDIINSEWLMDFDDGLMDGRMEEGIFANLCRITFVTEKCEKTDGNFCPKHRSPHPVRKKVKKNKMSQAFC